jgi:hypothetical protein
MTSTSVPPTSAHERYEIHTAVCRYRRQGLCCSYCSELLERVQRLVRVAVLRAVA